jgi:hypothetical protein
MSLARMHRGEKDFSQIPHGGDMPKQFVYMKDLEIAHLRWQLLLRNEGYIAAYRKFAEKHPGFPARLPHMLKKGKHKEIEHAYRDARFFENRWGCFPTDPTLNTCPFWEAELDPEANAPKYRRQTRSLRFDIPIEIPTGAIQRWVTYWTGYYKQRAKKKGELTKLRRKDIELALKVYDLKKAGKKYSEIDTALELDPEDQGTGPDRAKNLFGTAITWIRRAAMKHLWIDQSWMFDYLIDLHRRNTATEQAGRDKVSPHRPTHGKSRSRSWS